LSAQGGSSQQREKIWNTHTTRSCLQSQKDKSRESSRYLNLGEKGKKARCALRRRGRVDSIDSALHNRSPVNGEQIIRRNRENRTCGVTSELPELPSGGRGGTRGSSREKKRNALRTASSISRSPSSAEGLIPNWKKELQRRRSVAGGNVGRSVQA